MKKLLFTLLFLAPFITFAQLQQSCVHVDSVYSTCKAKDLGRRDIRFGIKQIVDDELSNKYCLSDSGEPLRVEIYYFGTPKTTLRIAGIEKTDQLTQVGVRIYYKGQKYEGIGESEVEVRAVLIELVDGKVPFSQTAVSSAIKKGIIECISKMP
jgi:hypothetical protein